MGRNFDNQPVQNETCASCTTTRQLVNPARRTRPGNRSGSEEGISLNDFVS